MLCSSKLSSNASVSVWDIMPNHNSIGSSPMESVEEFMYWFPYCAVERLVHSGKIEHGAGLHVTFRCTAFYSWDSNITPMI